MHGGAQVQPVQLAGVSCRLKHHAFVFKRVHADHALHVLTRPAEPPIRDARCARSSASSSSSLPILCTN